MKVYNEIGYVAGPYRSKKGEHAVLTNIRNAEAIAIELWKMGFPCLTPHLNTRLFGGVVESDQVWLDGDLIMLIRCDFVVLIAGWENSSGTCTEIEEAMKYDIPVYTSLVAFQNRTPLKEKQFSELREA